MKTYTFGLILFSVLFCPEIAGAQNVQLALVTDQLTLPVAIANAGDGSNRLFILEKAGTVEVWNGNSLSTFLDITDRVYAQDNETGLLGIAFHPDFETNGYFYLNYTTEDPGLTTRISRFQVISGVAEPSSELIVLDFEQPYANHNGGALVFGDDGYLYIATGDGGSFGDPDGNGQNLGTLLGKILRIDVDGGTPYAVPADNPFVGTPGAMEEIYAYGFRNPWRMTKDRLTGTIWIGDVGQNAWEEVDILTAGGNYGWDIMEGTHCYPSSVTNCDETGLIPPVYEYARASGNCSVTGGYVYRGSMASIPNGNYIFGDYCSGTIWSLSYDGNTASAVTLLSPGFSISSFGEDESGELYVLDYEGDLYRIEEVITGASTPVYPDIKVYPNPATSGVQIEIPEGETAILIELSDLGGRSVHKVQDPKVSSGTFTLNCSSFPAGLYNLKVVSGTGRQFVQQVVIE